MYSDSVQSLKIMKVQAICIKQYIDLDSLDDYERGEITFNEIVHYEKGEVYPVIKEYYDKEYYTLL